jgi:hypothetical protein
MCAGEAWQELFSFFSARFFSRWRQLNLHKLLSSLSLSLALSVANEKSRQM